MRFLMVMAMLAIPQISLAELRLQEPAELLGRAAQGKHQLRDVINELDQNLSEMRDVRVFDKYFFLLDELQVLAVRHQLDSIYPNAVERLGSRMVQKGVNWLDVVKTPLKNILYYHKWMQPSAAFSFLYAAELQAKEEKDLVALENAAGNLEAALLFADERWPNERTLRLLYRSTISAVAVRALKITKTANGVSFWIGKLYDVEAIFEVASLLHRQVYGLDPQGKSELHAILDKLAALHAQISKRALGAPEALVGQIGDIAVDIVMKSFRLEEKFSDNEFHKILAVMTTRHYATLAGAWSLFGKIPQKGFAGYYVRKAFLFISKLESLGLASEATGLSTGITARAAAILGREEEIEGTWKLRDSRGQDWNLVIAYASEDLVFASYADFRGFIRRASFKVIYDMRRGGYIALERQSDTDSSPNLSLRFVPQDDGTMEVEDLMLPGQAPMQASRTQTFPQYLKSDSATEDSLGKEPDLNGVYEGLLPLPGGTMTKATLTITLLNGTSVGNLRYLSSNENSVFNLGTSGDHGAIHLTRGRDSSGRAGSGTWMQLRAALGEDGYLRGHVIIGSTGLVPKQFKLKKVK
jgi:hypothetical protein